MCSINQGVKEILEKIQDAMGARDTYPLYGREMEEMKETIHSVLRRRNNTLWAFHVEEPGERDGADGVVLAPTEDEAVEKVKEAIRLSEEINKRRLSEGGTGSITVWPAELADDGGICRRTGVYMAPLKEEKTEGESMEKHVEFVSYDGCFPNLCTGTLTVRIDGKECRFGQGGNMTGGRFWYSGGTCNFGADCSEEIVTQEKWEVSESEIPAQYRAYADELKAVINDNVPYGCCGGCL